MEADLRIFGGRKFQAEGLGSTKALRQEPVEDQTETIVAGAWQRETGNEARLSLAPVMCQALS